MIVALAAATHEKNVPDELLKESKAKFGEINAAYAKIASVATAALGVAAFGYSKSTR